MSNFSRTKLFWQGTKCSNAARIAEKQAQEQTQAQMACERVKARYRELKEKAERGMAGTESPLKGHTNTWPGEGFASKVNSATKVSFLQLK